MTAPKITRSVATTYYGAFTLGQLRELVEAAADLGADARVDVNAYKGDQRDGSSVSFTIREATR